MIEIYWSGIIIRTHQDKSHFEVSSTLRTAPEIVLKLMYAKHGSSQLKGLRIHSKFSVP
jgi:hypothetical protein